MACFLFSGCAVRGPQTGDVKEDFLTVYGTYNYGGRYDAWLKGFEKALASKPDKQQKKLQAVMNEYYACVHDYVNDDFYEKMLAHRDIVKYEQFADENGYSYRTNGFEFEEYAKTDDETTYSFVAHLILTDAGGTEERCTVKGQITVLEKDGEAQVTNFYLSPIGFVPDSAQ